MVPGPTKTLRWLTGARSGCGPHPGPGGQLTAPAGDPRPRQTPSPLPAASSRPLWGSGCALGGVREERAVGDGPHKGTGWAGTVLWSPWPIAGQGRTEQGGRGLPRTCCSRPRITCTACCRISSLVCALSDLRCSWHMRPSSRKASLMSRTRTRSRALLAMRLSRSLRSFSSRDSTSSVLLGHSTEPPSGGAGPLRAMCNM